MKKIKVTFLDNVFEELKGALQWDGAERACYLLCNSSTVGERIKLLPYKVCVPTESDYVHRSSGYYSLDKPFINSVFNEAIDTESDVIQCHVHPGDPGVFSGVDEDKEPEIMGHIAEKIGGIYHGSLVFGNSLSTLDGWFYDRDVNGIIPIEKVMVVSSGKVDIFVPPRSPLAKRVLSPSLNRTIKVFGEEAVERLGLLDVGVIGASALGGPLLEFLARDRVNLVLICDHDVIEETNLNRLPGTTPSDIGMPKVDFYANYLTRINPQIEVIPFRRSFYDEEVQKVFSQADVVFGAVDSGARLSINRLALANLVPYFDFGAGISVDNGKPEFVGGQVYSVIPGREVCLSCSGVFNNLKNEYLSAEYRERERQQGYLNNVEGVPNPLVMFLDYTIAGIGYYQFLKYLWGTNNREAFQVFFDGARYKFSESTCASGGCLNCQASGFLGTGDKTPFMVPEKNKEPDIVVDV